MRLRVRARESGGFARALRGLEHDGVPAPARAKQIAHAAELDAALPKIVADPERLQQVVWNLPGNAVKFTPAGGSVTINARRNGAALEISFRDTGVRIVAESLPLVVERFRQIDGGTTRNYSRLGLGLAIARQLTELHGGTIDVKSGGPGTGAVFTLQLPLPAE